MGDLLEKHVLDVEWLSAAVQRYSIIAYTSSHGTKQPNTPILPSQLRRIAPNLQVLKQGVFTICFEQRELLVVHLL